MVDHNYEMARNIIKSLSTSSDLVKSNFPEVSYELFIYSLVAETIKTMPGVTDFTVHNPIKKPHLFKPKLSPGNLNTTNYSYISFKYKSKDFQIHLDTEYSGHSGVTHEIDISIISPNFKKEFLYLAIECKNYTHILPFRLAREFMGALSDFYQTRDNGKFKRSDFLVTSAPSPNLKIDRFISYKKRKGTNIRHSYAYSNIKAFELPTSTLVITKEAELFKKDIEKAFKNGVK